MNNLKYLRESAGLTKKELASLINATVYTYKAYEEEKMIMYDETKILISKIYGIKLKDIICDKDCISEEAIHTIRELNEMPQKERYCKLVYNLTGKSQEKASFNQIYEITRRIKDDFGKQS